MHHVWRGGRNPASFSAAMFRVPSRGGPPTGAAATTTHACGRGRQGRAWTHPLHRPTQIQGRDIQEVDTAGKEEKRTST